MTNKIKQWLWYNKEGAVLGFILGLAITLYFMAGTAKFSLEQQNFYWERYNLCLPCGEPRDLNCVIDLCKNNPEYLQNPIVCEGGDLPDRPDAFINGFCGHNQWNGFGYGKEPTYLKSLLSTHTFKETWDGIGMTSMIFYFIFPFLTILGMVIGAFIDSKWRKFK